MHCHSTASDGRLSPVDLVARAAEVGLSGLALTDHDTTAGLAAARQAAEERGLRLLNGIEISAVMPPPATLHLLGYMIDPAAPALRKALEGLVESRNQRNPQIVARLCELGMPLDMEEVLLDAKGGVVGRPHIAAVMIRKAYVRTVHEAFDLYMGPGRPAFVDKERLSARQAIEVIHAAGGVAVLAHPVELHTDNDAELATIVKDLVDHGLDGMEVYHSQQPKDLALRYLRLAERLKLAVTGGSDFHGEPGRGIKLGWASGRRIPFALLRDMEELAAARRGS
jgi:3',5'-nucleoside bisphosphate phosphatase